MQLFKKGAEACLYRDSYLGFEVIRKQRVPKPYRHPKLDQEIRASRTVLEARLLNDAKKAAVHTPTLYQISPESATLVMEFIEGDRLRESVEAMTAAHRERTFRQFGKYVAQLHGGNMVHGDLTTSNVIIEGDDQLRIVDFGLGYYSSELEARGVDLHLLLRTLESSHSDVAASCWRAFVVGYRSFTANAQAVLDKVREIRRRGRYVEERKQK